MGALRLAVTTKFAVAVIVALLVLVGTPALLGVARGNDSRVAARSEQVAAPAARAQPPLAAGAIPFTRIDVLLLVFGASMLFLLGSAVGRVGDDRPGVEQVDGDA